MLNATVGDCSHVKISHKFSPTTKWLIQQSSPSEPVVAPLTIQKLNFLHVGSLLESSIVCALFSKTVAQIYAQVR